MLCRGSEIALFTLNGEILLEQHICVEGDDMITSCAFYEGSGNEFLERNLIFTGHKRGVVNVSLLYPPTRGKEKLKCGQIWNLAIHDGRFALEHIKRMNHMDSAGFNIGAAISCILPMPQTVYTGDDDGRVVSLLSHSKRATANQVYSMNGIVYNDKMGIYRQRWWNAPQKLGVRVLFCRT